MRERSSAFELLCYWPFYVVVCCLWHCYNRSNPLWFIECSCFVLALMLTRWVLVFACFCMGRRWRVPYLFCVSSLLAVALLSCYLFCLAFGEKSLCLFCLFVSLLVCYFILLFYLFLFVIYVYISLSRFVLLVAVHNVFIVVPASILNILLMSPYCCSVSSLSLSLSYFPFAL